MPNVLSVTRSLLAKNHCSTETCLPIITNDQTQESIFHSFFLYCWYLEAAGTSLLPEVFLITLLLLLMCSCFFAWPLCTPEFSILLTIFCTISTSFVQVKLNCFMDTIAVMASIPLLHLDGCCAFISSPCNCPECQAFRILTLDFPVSMNA